MQDHELKKILLETCPVRPGQEGRAWASLKDRLNQPHPSGSIAAWFRAARRRGWGAGAAALFLIAIPCVLVFTATPSLAVATADSQSPGIYATAFYSHPAEAQVVWLNGMDPATDKPTYLDPTTVIAGSSETPTPTGDPNSL